MNNYIRYIVMLLVVGVASYFAHTLVLNGIETNHFWEQTDYTLLGMYSFGVGISLFVVVLTLLTQYAMPKNLGFVFLALMTINAIASYIYIKNGLNKFENDFIEYNFLVVFFLFLIFDVFVAFKALNQENNAQ
ncbi:MAG TPA: hypothetical protein VK023_09615 [Sphingobacterium bovisgrunnientis]|jgi:hypothetical protein|uniref:hypothetical protein n=1 Tax=Sphingobacterium cavernae TaxID=2592657 RepID=UPI00122FF59F|nr:hypothetical protein [Sphingobacterium cavernae]HLS38516.1 hypothetical protein [Sphingobacterium bovisgrunnientis]